TPCLMLNFQVVSSNCFQLSARAGINSISSVASIRVSYICLFTLDEGWSLDAWGSKDAGSAPCAITKGSSSGFLDALPPQADRVNANTKSIDKTRKLFFLLNI